MSAVIPQIELEILVDDVCEYNRDYLDMDKIAIDKFNIRVYSIVRKCLIAHFWTELSAHKIWFSMKLFCQCRLLSHDS